MPSFPSATIILPVEKGKTDQQIWNAVEELASLQWRSEILLVDQSETGSTSERITYRPVPKRFNSVAAAIKSAKHPIIGVIDTAETFDAGLWNMMGKRSEQFPIQTCFRRMACVQRTRLTLFKQILLWIYEVLIRLIFRSGRSEYHAGMTLLNRHRLEQESEAEPNTSAWDQVVLSEQNQVADGTRGFKFSIARLIATARLNRIQVSETKIENEFVETKLEVISTNSIRREIESTLKFWWNQIMFPRVHSEQPVKRFKSRSKFAAVSILLLVAAFVLFKSLNFPLFEPDEARNAQLALNAVNSGQWMSLTLAEENYWDKPPLQIWAIATSYKIFGVSQFATRLPIAIAALLTLMITVLIGQRLVGFRAAWLGGFLLLLTSGFICSGRYVTMDASLTTTVTAMLLFGFLASRNRPNGSGGFSKKYAAIAGVACGLGVLIKGPVIVVLCAPPLLMTYWLARNNREMDRKGETTFDATQPARTRTRLLWFALPALLIAGPWYLATILVHPEFLTYFFWKHHVVRFSAAFNHREPVWYYFVGIFIFMFPASYLIPSLTKFLTSRKPENRLLRTREHGFLFLSAVWIIGFFSISESKLPTYILPAFPFVCLLMGTMLEKKIFGAAAEASSIAHQAKTTWLEKIRRRAPFEMGFWFVVTVVTIVAFFKTETTMVGGLVAFYLVSS
jgi:4-amino-4-deoxy-L-arabinose transferase-like glycosyltransferase